MKGDLSENQLFSVKKVLKSAKHRYANGQKVCFSNLLVLVYIRTKFADYSARLADFREGDSIRTYRTSKKPNRCSINLSLPKERFLCSLIPRNRPISTIVTCSITIVIPENLPLNICYQGRK